MVKRTPNHPLPRPSLLPRTIEEEKQSAPLPEQIPDQTPKQTSPLSFPYPPPTPLLTEFPNLS